MIGQRVHVMRFRLGTFIAAVVVGMLIYAIAAGLLVMQISNKLIGPPVVAKQPVGVGRVEIFFATILTIGTILLLTEAVMALLRLRNRRKRDHCGGCGRRLDVAVGRCLHCGTRRALGSKADPGFPIVVMRDRRRT